VAWRVPHRNPHRTRHKPRQPKATNIVVGIDADAGMEVETEKRRCLIAKRRASSRVSSICHRVVGIVLDLLDRTSLRSLVRKHLGEGQLAQFVRAVVVFVLAVAAFSQPPCSTRCHLLGAGGS